MIETRRLEAFSDGVIAILITIMVLELHVPDALGQALSRPALQQFLPTLGAYALSFIVIGIMWINHHALIDGTAAVTRRVLWFNLLLLFAMSLVPPATEFLGRHPLSQVAAAAYGATLFSTSIAFNLLAVAIHRHSMAQDDSVLHRIRRRRYLAGLALYASSCLIALFVPLGAWAIFALTAALFCLPERAPVEARQTNPSSKNPRLS